MSLTEQQGKQACERIMMHSPTPWIRFKERGTKFPSMTNYVNSGDNVRTLAIIYGETIEQADANAKLIACAPEMLDFVIKFIDEYNKPEVDIDPLYKQAVELLDKATK